MIKNVEIPLKGYSVNTDVYEGQEDKPVVLSLIGRTSFKGKRQYVDFFPQLANDLGITTVIFDYSGHGKSPFFIDDCKPAEHSLEVVTVYDWIKKNYPNRKIIVIGSSYGGYMAARLYNFRKVDGLIFRAPATYDSDNFYLNLGDHDNEEITKFRNNEEQVRSHPFLRNAKKFEGKTLVITHEFDELIPRVVTDAFRDAFNADEEIIEGIEHSLDSASDETVKEYCDVIYNWLEKNFILQ